ncbi:MAG: 30S ribosomal protein S8 [Pyrinomonadaceae bacterium]
MTDPIADMLTRMRNAIAANHPRVDIPGSKLKMEVARILKEEGYINSYSTKGEGPKYVIRVFTVRRKGRLFDNASCSFVEPRPSCLCRLAADTEGPGRIRHQYYIDLERSNERQESPCGKDRRRAYCRDLLKL